MDGVLLAFVITLCAGLATGLGSMLAFFAKRANYAFLSFMLGLSAGVMVYVSLVEIFQKSIDTLSSAYRDTGFGYLAATIGFFVGVFTIYLIDRFLHTEDVSPHDAHEVDEMDNLEEKRKHSLLKMGTFTALAIGIHNFPEGLATFMSVLDNTTVGIAVAIAVAIHNIPEGVAVSIPIYHATGSRLKAFWYSFASGVAEPVGALAGYLLILPFMSDRVFGIVFAGVAGIMVYIALDELLPAAHKYGHQHLSIVGVIAGMMLMATSLVLFAMG